MHGSAVAHEPGNRIHFVQFKLDNLYRRTMAGFGSVPILMLIGELERDDDTMLVQGLLKSLLAELAAIVSEKHTERIPSGVGEQRVRVFLVELSERSNEPWRLDAMAKACAMGRSLFADTVLKLTGDTPSVHLRRLRVDRAERLLRETDMSLVDIALDCGLSNSQLFSRTFKEFNNQTPSQYRRAAGEKRPPRILDFTWEDEQRRMQVRKRDEWL